MTRSSTYLHAFVAALVILAALVAYDTVTALLAGVRW